MDHFVLVFSPNSLAGAPSAISPHSPSPAAPIGREAPCCARRLRFPSVTSISVKDALETVNAWLASLPSPSGGIERCIPGIDPRPRRRPRCGQHARIHDAAVLKTLGATRGRLLKAYIYEYALIGLCTALFGVAAVAPRPSRSCARDGLDFVWLWHSACRRATAVVVRSSWGSSAPSGFSSETASYLRDL